VDYAEARMTICESKALHRHAGPGRYDHSGGSCGIEQAQDMRMVKTG
jgi:hypothetical protein